MIILVAFFKMETKSGRFETETTNEEEIGAIKRDQVYDNAISPRELVKHLSCLYQSTNHHSS